MSDENVTVVGGHVVEQTDNSGVEATGSHAEEVEAAKAAVRKALAKETADESTEQVRKLPKDAYSAREDAEKVTDETPAKTAKPADDDADEAELKRVLKNREKLAKAKQAQNLELQKARQEAQQMWAAIQHEKRQLEAEKAKYQKFRTDPAAAIAEGGWDPEEFILSLAKEGTEEGKVAKMIRQQQQQLAEINQWREEQLRQREEQQRQWQMQQQVQQRRSVEQQFLGHAMNEDKHPHLSALYQGREAALIAEGDIVAAQYRELTGKEASLEDIAEYLEEKLAERTSAWYEKNAQRKAAASGQVPVQSVGKPAKGSKGRALTADVTSERRSLGKQIADLDGEERLKAAKEAVRLAIANSSSD